MLPRQLVLVFTRKSLQQRFRFLRTRGPLVNATKQTIAVGKGEQHERPAITQLWRAHAALNELIERAVGAFKEAQAHVKRHARPIRHRGRFADEAVGDFDRLIEPVLRFEKLLICVSGAARSRDREQSKYARKCRPEAVSPLARALGAANNFVEA